jgi:diguanylate cyclase (GGDEF)-like protein
MTITPLEDEDLGSALAMLWQRHRQSNLDRISLLEATTANVLRATIDEHGIADGASAAHKLAGSLGTFGFDAGSRAALEAESLLREAVIDGRLLSEAVTALRSSVEEVSDNARPEPATAPSDPGSSPGPGNLIVSFDGDLISRFTVEAAVIGMATTSTSQMPIIDPQNASVPESIIIDDAGRSWSSRELFDCVAELSRTALVFVLTDREKVEDRVEFARAGVAGVFPRSQGSRQMVSFLVEALERRRSAESKILALNVDETLAEALSESIVGIDCRLDIRGDLSSFWQALEEQGADLVVVGFDGAEATGPELCRIVRAHPRWHRLPIVVVGDRKRLHLDEAMIAGADDYLSERLTPHELGVRLHSQVERGRLAHTRSDTDPLTGTENRTSTERSLDRLMRLTARHAHPFAIALIALDQADHIRQTEGDAVCDVILRRLGVRLLGKFRGEDVVGRWSHDGFAVGLYGASSDIAHERITEVLRGFATEEFPTTSGKLARYTFSAGVASSPADGSTLPSLERHGETSLRRARAAQNCVVSTHERPTGHPANVVDVVLVDDDDAVADVIEYALGLRHYEFLRFSDGAEAAKALGEGHVKARVVLLDVGLPSLDGFGVLQTLRSQGILDDTRVIMLTVRSSEAEMLRALGLGATEHITKPFSIPVLLGRLDQTLPRSNA